MEGDAARGTSVGALVAGRYRLHERLGERAGATVWRALDEVLGRDVAVHVVPSSDPRAEGLAAAARSAAAVPDPRFLRVLDAATSEGSAYVVREWVRGHDLATLLANGPLPAQSAGLLAREVADAVSAAHAQGLCHLRLDPRTVLVTEDGAVKVAGLATEAVLRGVECDDVDRAGEDARGIGRLLYAGLTARWPGGHPTLPPAPQVDGRLASPRQVRAGVPRALDEVADRVLGDPPRHGTPLVDPRSVAAALTEAVPRTRGPAHLLDLGDGGRPTTVTTPVRPWSAAEDPTPPAAPAARAGGAGAGGGSGSRGGRAAVAGGVAALLGSTGAAGAAGAPGPPAAGRGAAGADWSGAGWTPPPPPPGAGTGAAAGGGGSRVPAGVADRRVPPAHRQRAGRMSRTMGVTAAVLLLLGAALVGFQLLTAAVPGLPTLAPARSPDVPDAASSSPPASPTPSLQPQGRLLAIAAVRDVDPAGDGEENPETVDRVVDRDRSTAWSTMRYFDPLEESKPGVGLAIDLGAVQQVSSVRVALVGSGSTLQLRATSERLAGSASPSQLSGWELLVTKEDVGTGATLSPDEPVRTRHLLLWFTVLPEVEDGFRAGVAEVTVRS